VYIGQLEAPFKDIENDAVEDAHIDKVSPEIIKFRFAGDEGHKKLLVGKHLLPDEGICHDVFSEERTMANDLVNLDF